ncbi:MAG TPA: glycine zipper 2TM domain-containing protein [Telluria sp.]
MKAVPAIAVAALVAGCAVPPHSGRVYSYYQTQQELDVRTGTVESVRDVLIVNPQSGTGVVSGAALGGIAGSYAGSGRGQVATSILGALAGGLLGQRIEAGGTQRPGLEITVRLDSGEIRAITQEADEYFRPGDRIRLLSDGQSTRVTH